MCVDNLLFLGGVSQHDSQLTEAFLIHVVDRIYFYIVIYTLRALTRIGSY